MMRCSFFRRLFFLQLLLSQSRTPCAGEATNQISLFDYRPTEISQPFALVQHMNNLESNSIDGYDKWPFQEFVKKMPLVPGDGVTLGSETTTAHLVDGMPGRLIHSSGDTKITNALLKPTSIDDFVKLPLRIKLTDSKLENFDFKLLQFMRTHGMAPNTVIYNTLLHALCKNEKFGGARSLMSEMKEPNDVTFNILISAYCNEQNLIQSLVLLEKCFSLGYIPDVVTVTKVMRVLCNEGRVSEALEVLERVESRGGKVDVVACNTLVKGYSALGKMRVAQRFFKEMERKGYLPNVETYNLLIAGFCNAGMLDSALDTFNGMKTDAVRWNFATFNSLIQGLSVGGMTDDGLNILELMHDSETVHGTRIDPYNSVIYGFYKENRWIEALDFLLGMEKLFPRTVDRSFNLISLCKKGSVGEVKRAYDQMIEEGGVPSVIVSHCLIHRYSQESYMEESLELINDMVSRGYLPQASTFNAVIIMFCKQDQVMNGIKFLEEMAERGCIRDGESYSLLLKEFCMKDDLQKAWLTFSRMVEKSIVPDSSMWTSLMFCLSQKAKINLSTSLQDIIES